MSLSLFSPLCPLSPLPLSSLPLYPLPFISLPLSTLSPLSLPSHCKTYLSGCPFSAASPLLLAWKLKEER